MRKCALAFANRLEYILRLEVMRALEFSESLCQVDGKSKKIY